MPGKYQPFIFLLAAWGVPQEAELSHLRASVSISAVFGTESAATCIQTAFAAAALLLSNDVLVS